MAIHPVPTALIAAHHPRTALPYLCLAALLLLVSVASQAQTAYVEGDQVYLPVVEDYPQHSSLQLRILRGTLPVEFVVERAGPAQGPVLPSSAWFDGSLLIVPEVWIAGASYWAELRELPNDRFRLEVYFPNPAPAAPIAGAYRHLDWEYMPGEANDIGVGADGNVWVVGTDYYGDGYGIYNWDGRNWWESYGSAVRVDVDPWGSPWVINDYDEIYRLTRGYWERIYGEARDIGIGADGSVWVIGVDKRRGGSSIYRLGSGGWVRVDGAGERIDVEPSGIPWVINDDNEIFRLENGLWRKMPGKARDIGIGADGTVWVIGKDEHSGGYGIYRFNGTGWDQVEGSGSQISVGPDGEPWVVNRDGDIYQSWGTYY